MATAGKQNGTITYLMHDGTKVTHQTEVSIDLSQDVIDTTTKDSNAWKEHLRGLRGVSISGTAYYAEDASEGFADMLGKITGRLSSTLRFTTGVTGDEYIEFTGTATSLNAQAGLEDVKSYSYTFESSGAPTVGTEA